MFDELEVKAKYLFPMITFYLINILFLQLQII
jgi:hypothetical protein